MSKLRSVSTAFWSDPFIEDLTPSQKLLFLYLITNEKTNMLGIYESSIKKISFETGIKKDDIEKALKEFERLKKVNYRNNYVILINYMKHQNFNTNMKKSAIDVYNNLPNELKDKGISISKDNPLEGFETLLNSFGMVRKVEVEYEVEVEVETKEELEGEYQEGSAFDFFWTLYDKKVGSKDKVFKKWLKLSKEDKDQINKYIPKYKLSQPDKQYRKNPETFINNEGWKDEILGVKAVDKPFKYDY